MGCLNGNLVILDWCSQDRSSKSRSSQDMLSQDRSSQDRSSQDRSSYDRTQFFLELKPFWTQHFFGPKIFLDSKCT